MTSAWPVSTVGDQFKVQLGKMLDSAKNTGLLKPYIGNRAVQWGRIDVSAVSTVPLTQSDLQRFRLRKGDLLVCEGGEVGRAAVWRDELPECYYQKALHRLRARCGYDVRVMSALLEYWASIGAYADYVTQTSIAHLPREKFVQMPLPLPSAAEQRRIGDALEDADDLIAALERQIAKKQAIKQGMTQQLLTGKVRLPGFVNAWSVQRVQDLIDGLEGGVSVRSTTSGGGPAILKTSSVNRGRFVPAEAKPIIESDIERARCSPVKGSMIISRMNTPLLVGDVGYVRETHPTLFLPDRLWMARPKRSTATDMRWLTYYLASDYGAERLRGLATGTSGSMKNIPKRRLLTLAIATPSEPEQQAIAQVLADADAEIDGLNQRLAKARDIKAGMMQQLLTGRVRMPVEAAS